MRYSASYRATLRAELLGDARADARISGAAVTGSASVDAQDAWSDIDLAFGVRDATDLPAVLANFSAKMYRDHGALDHLDVHFGAWIYRVFLLPNTLQVDLAFAPATEFGARGPTFRLQFGEAVTLPQAPPASAVPLIGWAWLYALHVCSSLARAKPWQADHMLNGMRDQVIALACLRHHLPHHEARGVDGLPAFELERLRTTIAGSIEIDELVRAYRETTAALLVEIDSVDRSLFVRLEPALRALASLQDADRR